jgi:ABC-type Zn uptake system ZnuABC Zn-binding protein ZnuA
MWQLHIEHWSDRDHRETSTGVRRCGGAAVRRWGGPPHRRTAAPPHGIMVAAILAGLTLLGTSALAKPLRVVASTPDLGSLVREVGGDQVTVAVLAKPSEDPHFVEAKPSFVKEMNQADLYVSTGLDLEMGYQSVLLTGARNARILPGSTGYVDASVAITPMDVPLVPVDRSMGDVHPFGNPHYLVDPLLGLKVAALLRDMLATLRPEQRPYFTQRYEDFERRIDDALVGPTLARKYGAEKLATLFEYGKLMPFLEKQGEASRLGGWLGQMAPFYGTKAVDDHPIWTYFARRFGLQIIGHMEPKPGVPPTTRHLQELIEVMKATHVPLILASAYYDPRHAELVASQTGATLVRMANQVGARPGTDDYIATVDYNVNQVLSALRGRA